MFFRNILEYTVKKKRFRNDRHHHLSVLTSRDSLFPLEPVVIVSQNPRRIGARRALARCDFLFFDPDEGANHRLRPQSVQVLPDVLGQLEGRAAAGSLPARTPGGAVQDGGRQVSHAVSCFVFFWGDLLHLFGGPQTWMMFLRISFPSPGQRTGGIMIRRLAELAADFKEEERNVAILSSCLTI